MLRVQRTAAGGTAADDSLEPEECGHEAVGRGQQPHGRLPEAHARLSGLAGRSPNAAIMARMTTETTIDHDAFASLALSQALLQGVDALGYERMTPIQQQ